MSESGCVSEYVTRYINSGPGTKYRVTAKHVEEWSVLVDSWVEDRLREEPDFERHGRGLIRIPRPLRDELKHGPHGNAALVGASTAPGFEESALTSRSGKRR